MLWPPVHTVFLFCGLRDSIEPSSTEELREEARDEPRELVREPPRRLAREPSLSLFRLLLADFFRDITSSSFDGSTDAEALGPRCLLGVLGESSPASEPLPNFTFFGGDFGSADFALDWPPGNILVISFFLGGGDSTFGGFGLLERAFLELDNLKSAS